MRAASGSGITTEPLPEATRTDAATKVTPPGDMARAAVAVGAELSRQGDSSRGPVGFPIADEGDPLRSCPQGRDHAIRIPEQHQRPGAGTVRGLDECAPGHDLTELLRIHGASLEQTELFLEDEQPTDR